MINPMDMTGRTVLVTGASSGIGRETCCLLSELGARLVLVGRDRDRLDKTLSMLQGQDHKVEPFDLTLVDEVPKWVRTIADRLGPLDGLVHSAGVSVTLPVKAWTAAVQAKVMTINVDASLALARGFRHSQVHRQPSSMVFVSSLAGLIGAPGLSVYSASKAAVIGLTRSAALELVRDGIRVNCVAPGTVPTEMVVGVRESLTPEQLKSIEALYPLGFGQIRDVSNAIAFLLADTGRWITGTTLVVDGGYSAQ